jgi:REP element-mobilizing transposase RayT
MRKSKFRPHLQLSLVRRKDPSDRRGGTRPGAGRPRKPGAISHSTRPRLAARFPQHVTLRIVEDAPSLAREYLMKIIRAAIAASHKQAFRVVHFNVLANHVHLITEAQDADTLARGMQGLEVRLARRLNLALSRQGKLFAHRFNARYLKTPREVRNCIRYVLLNRKHHAPEKKFGRYWIDPNSSAAWFDGWAEPIRDDMGWKHALVTAPAPTARATTWLLSTGWRRHGPLAFDERL